MAIRHFTLDEAEGLLSRLTELMGALRRVRDEALVKKAQMDLLWKRLEGGEAVLSELGDEQRRFDGLTTRLVAIAGDIESTGCILRDLDLGLIDFPFRARGGSMVYLCWKLGEPAIRFWHGTDEGFAGRKSLDRLPRDEA
ncbi:MAG: DUF2203 family protein [Bacillati bacterium ANGP1]|uniref:DUF2203 family protein n=1 Tax=Candidatus Segetimicrobium genomatis TaxID=2569760 RepID=A0A537K523_9BACT|nr:MAG: DUF2203 family protein [Terrabacteria group bacterium ANGP1]